MTDGPTGSPLPAFSDKHTERWHALVDILYLSQIAWLYFMAALYPFVGLFYGILFLSGGLSPKARRIGRVALILGIINLALAIIAVLVILGLTLTGAIAGLSLD